MKSPEIAIRDGVYAALNGTISAPVFGGKADPEASFYVVLEDITAFEQSTKTRFNNDVVFTLEIVQANLRAVSYKAVDTVYQEIMEILLPSVNEPGFSVAGFQAVRVKVDSQDFVEQHLDIVVRKIIRLRCSMVEYS